MPGLDLRVLRLERLIQTLSSLQAEVDALEAQVALLQAQLDSLDDPTLHALGALTGAANTAPYFTGVDVAALMTVTAQARALLDDADAAAQRSTLGTAQYTTGTFTAIGTGFVTSPTGMASWVRLGVLVVLMLPDLSGTSNATTCTITGIPAAISGPGLVRTLGIIQDNGAFAVGVLQLSGTSLTVYPNAAFGAWTATGAKGVFGPVMTYLAP